MEKKNNTLALVSLCLALGNIVLYVILFQFQLNLGIISTINTIVFVSAGICGIIGKNQISKDQTQKGKGMAITGIVIGFLGGAIFAMMALAVMKFDDPEETKMLCEDERLTSLCERTEGQTTTCMYGYNTKITCYTEVLKEIQFKK